MIHLVKFVKAIPLPIFYPDLIRERVHINLVKFPKDSLFSICFQCYIGSSERLNLTEDVINYILNNNIGTYYSSTFLVGNSILTDWVDIYFNNINPKLLLENI